MIWDATKKASLAVGGTLGVLTLAAGAPLYGAIAVGSAGVLATPKIVDFLASLKKNK